MPHFFRHLSHLPASTPTPLPHPAVTPLPALPPAGAEGPPSETLSVAGDSGTPRERVVGTEAEGRLPAKTGSLNNVTALSGWVSSVGGEDLAFAYVANTPDGVSITTEDLALQTDLGTALALWPEGIDVTTLGPLPVSVAADE